MGELLLIAVAVVCVVWLVKVIRRPHPICHLCCEEVQWGEAGYVDNVHEWCETGAPKGERDSAYWA